MPLISYPCENDGTRNSSPRQKTSQAAVGASDCLFGVLQDLQNSILRGLRIIPTIWRDTLSPFAYSVQSTFVSRVYRIISGRFVYGSTTLVQKIPLKCLSSVLSPLYVGRGHFYDSRQAIHMALNRQVKSRSTYCSKLISNIICIYKQNINGMSRFLMNRGFVKMCRPSETDWSGIRCTCRYITYRVFQQIFQQVVVKYIVCAAW